MPESPEVQELASFLTAHTIGREVRAVDVLLPKALKTQHPAPADLVGRRIDRVSRPGKMIDIATIADGDDVLHVIVHFGHDGWVLWHDIAPDGLKRAGEATLMARVRLSDGSGFDLTDAGQWKALTIHIVRSPTDVPAVAKLGLDPLDDEFDTAAFSAILANRKKQIKALLQDQTAFAGIGNAYSDEILHAARISPVTHAASLPPTRSSGWPTRPARSSPRPLRPDAACRHPSCAPPSTLRCGCTARPAQPAPSAAMRSGSTRSPAPRRSTVRPARPAGRCSHDAVPPGSRGYDGGHDDFSAARSRDPPPRRRRPEPAHGLGVGRIVLRRFRLRHRQLTHRFRSGPRPRQPDRSATPQEDVPR